jgi:hypothetical protein
MKQSKFSLLDIFTVLTAMSFGLVCFLGLNFYTLGDTAQSLLVSFIITVILSITALGAKLFKRAERNFKTNFVLEVSMLTIFTVSWGYFSINHFPHYFIVSDQKEEIQSKLKSSIVQTESMFEEYEKYSLNRKNLYKNKLIGVTTAKRINPSEYSDFGFVEGISDEKQINNKMFTVQADLFPSNFTDSLGNNGIKEVATNWLINAKSTTNNWKPLGIVSVVNDVEENSKNWRDQLVEFSKVRQNGEQIEDFIFPLSFDDIKQHFTTLSSPPTISLLLAFLAYVIMLLSWFNTKRDGKTFGKLAPYEVEL